MISVVIPVKDEQENLPELCRRLTAAMESCEEPWEVICVDDGSSDATGAILRDINARDGRWKALRLSRNFGHQPAVTAGIHHARGDAVVLIDGDLQDPPETIPLLIEKWRAGHAVVAAERLSRADGGVRGLGLRLFYPLFRLISELPRAPDAGIFCLLDRRVIEQFNRLPERNRFIPGLRMWLGFEQASVPYQRRDRAAGKAKQSLRRLIRYAMDGILSFSTRPLRAATYAGFLISGFAFLLAIFYVADFFIRNKPLTGFTTIIVCVLFLGGVQLISIGILGAYIGRIYEEVKQRPLYVVAERIGIQPVENVGTSTEGNAPQGSGARGVNVDG